MSAQTRRTPREDLFHVAHDEEYLRQLKAEEEFWDTTPVHIVDDDRPLPREAARSSNERLTGEPDTEWFETISRYGTFQVVSVRTAWPIATLWLFLRDRETHRRLRVHRQGWRRRLRATVGDLARRPPRDLFSRPLPTQAWLIRRQLFLRCSCWTPSCRTRRSCAQAGPSPSTGNRPPGASGRGAPAPAPAAARRRRPSAPAAPGPPLRCPRSGPRSARRRTASGGRGWRTRGT